MADLMLDESRQTLVDVTDDGPGNPWAAWFVEQIDGMNAQLAATVNQLNAVSSQLALVVEQTASLSNIVGPMPGGNMAMAVSFSRPTGPVQAIAPHKRARMNNA